MKLFPFSRFTVSGNSMYPTLKPSQSVISSNWHYFFKRPKKGDIVVLKQKGRFIVKRLQKVSDRHIFVVGDNLNESTDSREYGVIDKNNLIGKVVITF